MFVSVKDDSSSGRRQQCVKYQAAELDTAAYRVSVDRDKFRVVNLIYMMNVMKGIVK